MSAPRPLSPSPAACPAPVLDIRQLTVAVGDHPILKGVSLSVGPGEKLAVIGESGSGKSVTMLSVLGLFQPRGVRIAGSAMFAGRDLIACTEPQMAAIRGRAVGMIFQDPMTSLNPAFTTGTQLADVIRTHDPDALVADPGYREKLLASVGIEDAARCLRLYPHELSGGMRQRVMIAMAIACKPRLLIADEPTTALDVTVQRQIVGLLVRLCEERGIGLIFISHNLDLVGEFCDRITVMLNGEIVETGSAEAIFGAPAHPYTRRLLAAIPRIETAAAVAGSPDAALESPENDAPILAADAVGRFFPAARSAVGRLFNRSGAFGLEACSLRIGAGELVGIVGESGSGKTTLARLLVGLDTPSTGSVRYKDRALSGFAPADWRQYRRAVQMVFQGAQTSLNPRKTIAHLLTEAMRTAGVADEKRRTPAALLEMVQLAAGLAGRYPHELSGGQRQRVGIARALALSPEVLIADEPTSALDVSVQKDIIELLAGIQRERRMTMLIVSHDLGLIGSICNRTIVMRKGRIVESGPTSGVLLAPREAYTRQLIEAVPRGLAGRHKYRGAYVAAGTETTARGGR